MKVETFQGEYRFLSNMYPLSHGLDIAIGDETITVPTTENPYQAAKFVRGEAQIAVMAAKNGYDAKRLARDLEEAGEPVRDDWSQARLELMQELVRLKFQQYPELSDKLLATGNDPIEEGNEWNDTFWGISPPGSGEGQNQLGEILMDMREALRLEAKNKAHHPDAVQSFSDYLNKIFDSGVSADLYYRYAGKDRKNIVEALYRNVGGVVVAAERIYLSSSDKAESIQLIDSQTEA